MATATTLPFTRPNSAAATLSHADSMSRIGLFFILALSIGILIVAIVNLRMGSGKEEDSSEDADETKEKKDKGSYPNKTRDYIILTASILSLIVSIPSIIATYPKKM